MNRKQFIKTSIAAIPLIALSTNANHILSSSIAYDANVVFDNTIEIFTLKNLKKNGIRSASYSASCYDKNGVFAHEPGFDEKYNEPFVRKTYLIKSLPIVTSDSLQSINNFCPANDVLNEIKDKMEYVCLVWYVKSDKWYPIVGGMTKLNYKFKVGSMNATTKEEYNDLVSKYESHLNEERKSLINPWNK